MRTFGGRQPAGKGGITDYPDKAAVNKTPKYGGLYGQPARVITIAGVLYQWTGNAIQAISVGATDAAPPAPPATPTLSASAGVGQVTLTLSALAGGNTRTATRTTNGITVGLAVGSATSYVDSGVTAGVLAAYAVYDTNGTGDSGTATASATPTAPAVPSVPTAPTLSVTVVGTALRVTLSAGSSLTSRALYRGGTLLTTLGGGVNSYDDSTVTAGTTYSYTARDTNVTGQGGLSAAATGLVPVSTAPVFNAAFAQTGDVHYFIEDGQSLGSGIDALPLQSIIGHKRAINFGSSINQGGNNISVAASTTYYASSLLESTNGETGMYGAMDTLDTLTAAQMGALAKTYIRLAGNSYAVSGLGYAQLAKGTPYYATLINGLTRTMQAMTAAGRTLIVPGVFFVHGEADESALNTNYAANLLQMWTDLNTDIKALTGQTQDILMWISQTASYCFYNHPTPTTDQQMYLAARDNPAKIKLLGSKYHLTHSDTTRVHLTGPSAKQFLGEKQGQAAYQTHYTDTPFKCVMPSGSPTGALSSTITCNFQTNGGPLVLDTTTLPDHYLGAKGFELIYQDLTAAPAITGVSVSGTVATLALASALTKPAYLRYAWTTITNGIAAGATTSRKPGPTTGATDIGGNSGNLRDSDPFASTYGYQQQNWAVTFQEAIV